jgi:sialidase-1
MKTKLLHNAREFRITSRIVVLLWLVCCSAVWPVAPAAEPFLEKEDVFVRGADGYHTYRIPGLVATRSGALLLFCDARVNSGGDIGKMNLVLKRSLDGGATWEKLQVLGDDPGPETKIGNVSAVADPTTGAVHAIYCQHQRRRVVPARRRDHRHVPAVSVRVEIFRDRSRARHPTGQRAADGAGLSQCGGAQRAGEIRNGLPRWRDLQR